jgi:hypothetical protein
LPTGDADNATFTVAGTNYKGQWLKLQLPQKIRVESIVIAANRGGGVDDRRPHEGVFLGSNDNTNWELIKLFDIDTSGYVDFQSGADSRATISDITSTSHYEYIMFVITKIATTNQYGPVQINEIEYYGIPEYDPEAHGTDVIMRSVPNVPNTDWLEVYYDAKDLADGTVATVNDLKPSGLGTALNSSSTNNITVSDGAFVFNGTTSYIKIDDLTNPSGAWTHSVVAWINSSDLGMFDFTWIGDTDAATTRQSFTFQEGGQNLTLGINANNVKFTFSPPLQKSKWHHVVYTFNGGAAGSASTAYKVFVDGVEANQTGGVGTGTLSLPGDSAIWIGRDFSGTYNFKGSIANFRLFNRALTGDEIWQLYAYQKDYFQVSPDVVTFKGGRLGIGTLEPRAVLDVRGSFHAPGTVVQVVTKPVVGQYAYSGNATDVELTALTTSFTPKFGDSLVLVQVYLSYEADYNAVIFIRANANDIPTNQGRTYGQQEGVIPVSFDNNVGSTPNSSTFVVHHILNGETSVQYKVYYRNNTTTGTIKLNQGYSAVDEKGMCYIVITEIAQ